MHIAGGRGYKEIRACPVVQVCGVVSIRIITVHKTLQKIGNEYKLCVNPNIPCFKKMHKPSGKSTNDGTINKKKTFIKFQPTCSIYFLSFFCNMKK